MSEGALDPALDELYGSDPADFVAVRKRLAADLRAAGDKDAAKDLQAARRPSTSAWALNQLARRRPEVVEALLERSSDLQAAQTHAVAGNAEALRDAMRAHRAALDDATTAALAILEDRANDGFRSEIVATLRAASADDGTSEQLRTGRLIREAEFRGFPDAGLTLVPQPATQPRAHRSPETRAKQTEAKPATARATDDRAAAKRAQDEAAAAQAARDRAARRKADLAARKAALRTVETASRDATRSQARVDQLLNELDLAQRAVQAARDREHAAANEVARLDAEIESGIGEIAP